MSFFKRLKEKLVGSAEEEKVKEELEQQEETKEPEAEAVEEVPEEATAVTEEESEPAAEESDPQEEEQAPVEEAALAVVEDEHVGEDEQAEETEEKKPSAWSITQKFKLGLAKTRDSFTSKVNDLVARYRKVDEDFFEELEDVLLQADVGFETVMELMDKLRFEVQRKNIKDTEGIQTIISEKLVEIYEAGEENLTDLHMQPDGELTVILFVGVNGVGKTTTIGKLAHRLKSQGKSVLLAAGDTFRAGAIDQLQVWGDRVGCEVIKQSEGSDPAAVMYLSLIHI